MDESQKNHIEYKEARWERVYTFCFWKVWKQKKKTWLFLFREAFWSVKIRGFIRDKEIIFISFGIVIISQWGGCVEEGNVGSF